ncbi:GTP diphosphokinase [Pseudoteredinibacter isoporae]|uniref:GTP pyrophosphokinase n=1 Tax=Pseudoteredinibacter isoporae TaxID=570281 RepID=A0A7X0JY68_9GAMM|nr:GTP diphosphokinase [Pseudoteredinibacter isoporae]MBB6523720.1 GTP pyrophosphokinase [Pseudoteredinibacter isoporae]NHO89223.1 GTP diphosphokinase [Pseudoteredinibacter isoporae]NIB22166.1 GTP diphosphokinase [Pseudoteredinibacter isoporae]
MVKVREDHPISADGSVDIPSWIRRLQSRFDDPDQLSPADQALMLQVCQYVQEIEESVEPSENSWADSQGCFRTGLEMAEILADLQADTEVLLAAILYRAVREHKLPLSRVEKKYGESIASLISGVLRMAAISNIRNDSEESVLGSPSAEQAENIRKMLVAMVDDVRVALIKLAERTCAIRAAKHANAEKKRRVAREVSDVYAPLAHRLGIGHIKWELEDLAFRYLEPDDYMHIAKLLDERRVDRQDYIENVIQLLQDAATEARIEAEIQGRAKHIYSIWRKMRRKDIGFSQVYDIRAVRVLVPTVRDCYTILGIVHSQWRLIPNEFDDYIASPKENGYRSLHTAVIGPDRKVLEIQIRTHSMHEEAEFGVCAHWKYKGTDDNQSQDSYEQKIAWLRQVLEWSEELGTNALEDDLQRGVEQDRVYVFTPDGHVIDLPPAATVLDFAYRIHTDVGHRCCGAKLNGRIVPLNQTVNTGDQIEILTGKRESPSRDWLSPALGYLNTARARAKVQQWFKLQARDQHLASGRALLDKEFKRLAVDNLDFEALAQRLNLKSLESLYVAVGASDISVGQVLNAAQKLLGQDQHHPTQLVGRASEQFNNDDVYIDGVGNLMTTFARCCHPVPGDSIAGYITLGRGVSIHRQDCSNLLQLQMEEPTRIIEVSWSAAPQDVYAVSINVEAIDRHGLLRDITALLDVERINITSMQTLSNKSSHTVSMQFDIEIHSYSELSRVLERLNRLPNVESASRKK